jgi:hypothetical protein
VVIVAGNGGVTPAIKVKRKVYIHQVPLTRIWVATILSGVPVGAQIAWLSCSKTGTLPALTRVAALTHWAVAQGGLPVPVNPQPAMV